MTPALPQLMNIDGSLDSWVLWLVLENSDFAWCVEIANFPQISPLSQLQEICEKYVIYLAGGRFYIFVRSGNLHLHFSSEISGALRTPGAPKL